MPFPSRVLRFYIGLVVSVVLLVWTAAVAPARRAPDPPRTPGPQGGGVTLLPNGWTLAPAGRHIPIGDLPLAMVLSADGRRLIVTNNGWAKPTLTVVDVDRLAVTQRLPLDHAWLGLAWHPDGTRLYSSGAAQNSVLEIEYAAGKLGIPTVIPIAQSSERPGSGTNRPAPIDPQKQVFIGGSGEILGRCMMKTGFRLGEAARSMYDAALEEAGIGEGDVGYLIATGYGRFQVPFADAR